MITNSISDVVMSTSGITSSSSSGGTGPEPFVTGSNATLSGHVIATGQGAYASDTALFKIGNGTSTFHNLPIVGADVATAVNVLDYGAKGDYNGSTWTDNATAFAAAYAAATWGGTIVIPAGTYYLSASPTGSKYVEWDAVGNNSYNGTWGLPGIVKNTGLNGGYFVGQGQGLTTLTATKASSSAATTGSCIQAVNPAFDATNETGALIGLEVDVSSSGLDNNGERIGINVALARTAVSYAATVTLTGTTATLTFASPGGVPFPYYYGNNITVGGFPTGTYSFNGSYQVLASPAPTSTTVSYIATGTPAATTVVGTVSGWKGPKMTVNNGILLHSADGTICTYGVNNMMACTGAFASQGNSSDAFVSTGGNTYTAFRAYNLNGSYIGVYGLLFDEPGATADIRLSGSNTGGDGIQVGGNKANAISISGTNTTGVYIPGANTTGVSITGACASAITINPATGTNLTGVYITGSNSTALSISGSSNAGVSVTGATLGVNVTATNPYNVGGVQVVGAKAHGFGTSGTGSTGSITTPHVGPIGVSSMTVAQVGAALLDVLSALTTHGLLGT